MQVVNSEGQFMCLNLFGYFVAFAVAFGVMGASAVAQTPAAAVSIESVLADAARAEEDERWQDALKLYEHAYLLDADGYYIYKRALVYEQMGEEAQALALLEDQREEIAASERVTELPLTIERLRRVVNSREKLKERKKNVGAWALTGGGVVTVTTGVVMTLVGRGQALDVVCAPSSAESGDARCEGRAGGSEYNNRSDWQAAWDRANRTQTGGVIVTSLGGVMLTSGIIWLLVGRQHETSVSITPDIAQDRVGASWSLTF